MSPYYNWFSIPKCLQKTLLVWLFLLALCLTTGCNAQSYVQEARETHNYSFEVSPNPSVTIDTMQGNLQIHNGEEGMITLSAEWVAMGQSEASAQSNLSALVFNVAQEANTINITADHDWALLKDGDVWVNYQLGVPKGTTLNIDMERYMNPPNDYGIFSWFWGLGFFVMIILSGFLWGKLRRAHVLIEKLKFELSNLKGEVDMLKLERKWRDEK